MVKSHATSPLAGREGRLIGASRILFTHTVGASVDVMASTVHCSHPTLLERTNPGWLWWRRKRA